MAPKKKPNDNKSKVIDQGPTETEKEMFMLEIAALNNKIARLRGSVDSYEQENLQLQEAYEKLDQDRTDVITFLKKTLANKNEEVNELKEKVKGLEEIREIETKEYKGQIAELENNFSVMKGQLSSENKLLSGKLNTLEEFRATRNDLMMKFEKQEQDFKDQELTYKKLVYEAEKKLIISKGLLKKDMEKRLLQLASDFQDASELRIAASTHRVLRENIAVNREFDKVLQSQEKLRHLIEKYKHQEKKALLDKELAEEERDTAIRKSITQLKVIEQLTSSMVAMKKEYARHKKIQMDVEEFEWKLKHMQNKNEFLTSQVAALQQQLHSKENAAFDSETNTHKIVQENKKLKRIIRDAVYTLEAVFKIDRLGVVDLKEEIENKNLLLKKLLGILAEYHIPLRADSGATIINFDQIYKPGALGIVPSKELIKTKQIPRGTDYVRKDSILVPEQEVSEVTVTSLSTIPSIVLVPYAEASEEVEVESVPSFTRSNESEISEDSKMREEETIERKLARSKLAIEKSALADLKAFSALSIHSLSKMTFEGFGSKMTMQKADDGKENSATGLEEEKSVEIEGAAHEEPQETETQEKEASM